MVVGRLIGWIFILVAMAALGHEIIVALESGQYRFIAFGEQWFKINGPSLNLSQAVVQRYVADWLWDPVVTNVILFPPTWLVFAIPGVFLAWAFRSRNGRRR